MTKRERARTRREMGDFRGVREREDELKRYIARSSLFLSTHHSDVGQ